MQPTSFRGAEIAIALVSLATSTLAGVTVYDGPAVDKPSVDRLLMVGWAPFIERHAVGSREDEDMCGRPVERGQIACYIATRDGNASITAVRNDAVGILTSLEAAIRADKGGLGGSVDNASIGDIVMTQHQTDEGASIGLAFAVTYEAWI